MKLTIDIGSDEEMRKEILHMVAVQIKKITGDEIRKIAQDHLQQVNVAAKITNAIKDTLNRQMDFMLRGYGDLVIKQELEKKFVSWIEKNFNTYFDEKVKGYVKNYIEEKASSFQDFLNIIKKK